MGASPTPGSKRRLPSVKTSRSPEAREEVFTCPICLVDVLDPLARAVTLPCMHSFCRVCLVQWLHIKRNCPVCKGALEGYLFDIKSDESFQQYLFSPEHPSTSGVGLLADRVGTRSRAGHPRPYYWRLRQRLSAEVTARGPTGFHHKGDSGMHDSKLRKRRAVYAKGLRPLHISTGQPGRHSCESPREVARLEQWIDRELRALIGVQDTSILTAFVMALVRSYGFSSHVGTRHTGAAGVGSTRSRTAQVRRMGQAQDPIVVSDPVSALESLLQGRAEHFWHELRSFATSRMSMDNYDDFVQYSGDLTNSEDSGSTTRTDRSKRKRRCSDYGHHMCRSTNFALNTQLESKDQHTFPPRSSFLESRTQDMHLREPDRYDCFEGGAKQRRHSRTTEHPSPELSSEPVKPLQKRFQRLDRERTGNSSNEDFKTKNTGHAKSHKELAFIPGDINRHKRKVRCRKSRESPSKHSECMIDKGKGSAKRDPSDDEVCLDAKDFYSWKAAKLGLKEKANTSGCLVKSKNDQREVHINHESPRSGG